MLENTDYRGCHEMIENADIRGRHADNPTKICGEIAHSCGYGGHVNLRIEDCTHPDFWLEFKLDVTTLGKMLAKAKESMALHNLLFPQFLGDRWAKVNLNDLAWQNRHEERVEKDQHWITLLNKKLGVDHTWGGYLEHRDFLLRNHYNKDIGTDHFWHLGIDYNAPFASQVHLPVDAELVYSVHDTDQDGGWGGKLIFKTEKGYFILGHLALLADELKHYKKGNIVGYIADRDSNGGWFPHLHIQCCREFKPDVDGYSHWYPGIKRDFPDPVVFFGVDNIDKANDITEKILVHLSKVGIVGDALETISPEAYDLVESDIADIINENLE